MQTLSTSFAADSGAKSQKITISGTSAQSATITPVAGQGGLLSVTVDTNAFMRYDTDPTALATGVDRLLLANVTYRVQVGTTGKFAFITSGGTGSAYITQEW